MTTIVKAGDLIKSYDFAKEIQPGCYMIGLVKEIEADGIIVCDMIKSFFDGKAYEHPNKEFGFKTLAQGLGMFDDRDTRIEMIATAEQLALVMSEGVEIH